MPTFVRRGPRRSRSHPHEAGLVLANVLQALGGGVEQARLIQLWRNWSMAMGPDLAPLAWPLGRHKDLLLIGAEDAMLMQELHLQSAEILERANAFMEGDFFSGIKVSLTLGKHILGREPAPAETPLGFYQAGCDANSQGATPSGQYLEGMDPASAVARCYARFADPNKQTTGRGSQKAGQDARTSDSNRDK